MTDGDCTSDETDSTESYSCLWSDGRWTAGSTACHTYGVQQYYCNQFKFILRRIYILLQPNSFYLILSNFCASYEYLKFVTFNFWFSGMANERSTILQLHPQRKRQCDIICLLVVCVDFLSKAVEWFKEVGEEGDCPGKQRKRTFNTPRSLQIINKLVQ